MQCHYEILGVARDASDDAIKKAYKKLALKWHPDKNLDNETKAKEQFQLVQQAWDILSDPHERTWYDNHREAILKSGQFKMEEQDKVINLFSYFSASCFKGYGDDAKGFYTVYRNAFENLTAEDARFAKDDESDEEIPIFGDSQSCYEDVHNFYAYWQSYNTKISYTWLDPYDIRNMSNRRMYRLAEKENKKVRDKAKRERNEQVRNLVAFIRKRDKRVEAHVAKLAERSRENFRKMEERKKEHLLERQKLLREHNESEWSKFSNIEAELKKIETDLVEEFEVNNKTNNSLYCIACNKIFQTEKAFMNHENSRKHKENINAIKHIILNNDNNFHDNSQENNSSSDQQSSVSLNEVNLATDSQIPDFLLNPSQNNSKQLNDEDNEYVSPAELMSNDEDDSECSQQINVKEKINVDVPIVPITTQMENISFLSQMKNENDDATSEGELISDQEEESPIAKKSDHQKKKTKSKKQNIQVANPILDCVSDNDVEINEEMWLSKKQRKKLQRKKAATIKQSQCEETLKKNTQEIKDENKVLEETEILPTLQLVDENLKANIIKNGCKKEERQKQKDRKDLVDIADLTHCCATCLLKFSSKNKLFTHLKKTRHSVYIPELQNEKNQEKQEETSRSRKKNNSDKKKRT